MSFPRQRHDGTNEKHPLTLSPNPNMATEPLVESSNTVRTASWLPGHSLLLKKLCAGAFLFTGACFLSQTPALAKKAAEKPSGAWAWTSGSQTYFRARPSALTPAVAKVPKGTKVFVWGKFDGWYRVESQDHKFGWVYHDYIHCPKNDKIKELSHRKAKLASDRTENQTMYGSPALLKRHYAKYKAAGAARGLEKQGVRLVAAKPKAAPAKVAARPAVKSAPAKVAAKPAGTQQVRPVAWPAPKVVTAPKEVAAPKTATPQVAAAPKTVVAPQTVVTVPQNATPVAARISPAAPDQIAAKPAVAQKPVAKAKPKVAAKPKPAPRVAQQPRPNRLSAREMRRNRQEMARNAKREQLRAKLGSGVMAQPAKVVPPLATGNLRPLTPAELMQAREAYLSSQKTEPKAAPAATAEPTQTEANASEANAGEGAREEAVITPSSTSTGSNSNWNLASDAQAYLNLDLNSSAPQAMVIQVAHTPKSKGKAAPVGRGGSPRDYAREQSKNTFGQSMANQALGYRGMPYIRGAESPNRGFDCSGLIYYLLRQRGYNPPRTAAGLASYGKAVPRNQLKPGDILLFANTYRRGISHVAIYMGNNKFVHAANASKGVRVDSLSSKYYQRHYYGARRVK